MDDSDAAPLSPTLVALQKAARDRVETADVLKGGMGARMSASSAPRSPLHPGILFYLLPKVLVVI